MSTTNKAPRPTKAVTSCAIAQSTSWKNVPVFSNKCTRVYSKYFLPLPTHKVKKKKKKKRVNFQDGHFRRRLMRARETGGVSRALSFLYFIFFLPFYLHILFFIPDSHHGCIRFFPCGARHYYY